LAFDSEDEVTSIRKLHNLALIQITPSDHFRVEEAKRIVDGISLFEAVYSSFRVVLNTEPIPPSYSMVTNMVIFKYKDYSTSSLMRLSRYSETQKEVAAVDLEKIVPLKTNQSNPSLKSS